MLNYTRKNINILALCISIVISILLFILLDILIFNNINKYNENEIQKVSSIRKHRKLVNSKVIDLQNGLTDILQIADIFEGVTVEQIEAEDEEKIELLNKTNKWRIEIPKINLNAPIQVGTGQDILAKSVGHFEETASWNGNVALAGHNRGYKCNFFEDLKKLKIGDRIIYHTKEGTREYKVIMNKIIKQTDWTYVQGTNDNRITLITCVENMREYRRCVQAVEII